MRALITGGAGFIGSHLAGKLLSSGWEVSVIDDLSTGSMKNIHHLKREPGFQYVIESVMNRPLLAELVDDCDIVFHLAAAVGVRAAACPTAAELRVGDLWRGWLDAHSNA